MLPRLEAVVGNAEGATLVPGQLSREKRALSADRNNREFISIAAGTFSAAERFAELKSHHAGRSRMMTSDRLLRFAAECEVMAKFTQNSESRVTWNRIAQRWMRCAELLERQDSERERRRKPARPARLNA
jgi:hypothetical protein